MADTKKQDSKESVKKQVEENLEFGGIMDNTIDDVVVHEVADSGGGDENIYNLSLSQDGVLNKNYRALGRFVPNPFNTPEKKLNVLTKFMYFLPNPDNPDGKLVVDCTSNWGQRDNIITKAFFYCRNSSSPALKSLGKRHFSRKQYSFTLFQIIKDSIQPDLNGKVKIFRFAKQVEEIIEKVTTSDPSVEKVGVNYSHPFDGVNFIVDVREKEYEDDKTGQKKTMTSYEQSEFQKNTTILKIPGYEGKIEKSKEYVVAIFNYLKAESPNLADYEAKEWTPELEQMIIESVRMTLEDDHVFDTVYKKTYGKSYFGAGKTVASGKTVSKSGMKMEVEGEVEEEVEEIETTDEFAETNVEPENNGVYAENDELPAGLEEDDEFAEFSKD